MKLDKVAVTYERKENLGDYSSANIGCTLWADLEDGDDPDEVMRALWNMARSNVKAVLVPIKKKQEAQLETVYLGLPVELRQAVKAAMQDDISDGDLFGDK